MVFQKISVFLTYPVAKLIGWEESSLFITGSKSFVLSFGFVLCGALLSVKEDRFFIVATLLALMVIFALGNLDLINLPYVLSASLPKVSSGIAFLLGAVAAVLSLSLIWTYQD